MSWKITKKLKETHLAPISNPFSRSSSTSTIVPQDSPQQPEQSGVETPETQSIASPDTKVSTTEQPASQSKDPQRPDVLVVTLQEGSGLSLDEKDEKEFQSPATANGYARPTSAARPGSNSSYASNGTPIQGTSGRPKTSGGVINAVPTIHGRYSSKYLPYALIDFDKQQVFVNGVSGSPENPVWAGDSTQYKFDVSRKQDLSLSIYIRNPNAPPQAGRSSDLFIGSCRISPKFEAQQDQNAGQPGKTPSPAKFNVTWNDIVNPRDNQMHGRIKVGVAFVESVKTKLDIKDFDLLKVVGKGSFGKVMQVKMKQTGRVYALKTIKKAHIIARSEVSHTLAERTALAQINNPFIVPLKFSFQSRDKLYLVLAFVNGGELFHHLQKEHTFHVNRARFYTAELLCALECLHGFNVIYRDLKPENILLDYSGHIALCDFGLCKMDMKDEDRTNTFCGTPEYLAPELLEGRPYTKSVDWWTLGILLYEMLTGLPPFYNENTNEMYRKILTDHLTFPHDMLDSAKDLLSKLLDRNPERRLGANGAAEIKAHAFFAQIDWSKLLQRKYEPMFKPNVADQLDTANFDQEFTQEAPTDSYVEGPMLSQTMQDQFAGWSYNRPVAGLGDAGGSVKDPSFGSVLR